MAPSKLRVSANAIKDRKLTVAKPVRVTASALHTSAKRITRIEEKVFILGLRYKKGGGG